MSVIERQEGVQWIGESVGQAMITGALLGGAFVLTVLLWVVVCIGIDWGLIRRVWRAANKPLPSVQA